MLPAVRFSEDAPAGGAADSHRSWRPRRPAGRTPWTTSRQTSKDDLAQWERELQDAVVRQDRAGLERLVGAEFSLTSARMNVGRDEWIELATGRFKVESAEIVLSTTDACLHGSHHLDHEWARGIELAL